MLTRAGIGLILALLAITTALIQPAHSFQTVTSSFRVSDVSELNFLRGATEARWIDNSRVLFMGGCGIGIADIDNQQISCLLDSAELPDLSLGHARLNRNARMMVFDAALRTGAPGGFENVWLKDLAAGKLFQLTHDNQSWAPSWSPDGMMIAYARGGMRISGQQNLGIWIMKSDGTGSRAVTGSSGNRSEFNPAWGPRGDWIAYVAEELGAYSIWLVRADGTGNHQVSPLVGAVGVGGQVNWAQDESYLVASFNYGVISFDLSDGSQIEILHGNATHQLSNPDVSPDATRLLYILSEFTSRSTVTYRVYLAFVRSNEHRSVSDTSKADQTIPILLAGFLISAAFVGVVVANRRHLFARWLRKPGKNKR